MIAVSLLATPRDPRGDGSVTVSYLNPGEAKPFSKAWMARVVSLIQNR
jgi:hypothetical protein